MRQGEWSDADEDISRVSLWNLAECDGATRSVPLFAAYLTAVPRFGTFNLEGHADALFDPEFCDLGGEG